MSIYSCEGYKASSHTVTTTKPVKRKICFEKNQSEMNQLSLLDEAEQSEQVWHYLFQQ